MKSLNTVILKKRFLIPGAITTIALIAAPVVIYNVTGVMDGVISTAYAAGQGKGYGGGHDASSPASGGGATDGKGKSGPDAAPRGRQSLQDVLSEVAEEEPGEDSDRPPWAGTPGKEGKPGGGSSGSDTKKGTDYGDLWIILRDDEGNPILTDGGFVQPLDADGNLIPLDEEGHPLDESLTQEVEIGRMNIARAPDKVLDHSLTEAVTKMDGITITPANIDDYTDTAGRLVDATGNTIDSPLESLALYTALVNGTANQDGNIVISVGDASFTVNQTVALDLAASAFAAAADKTANLSVDQVAYISGFLDANLSNSVANYTYDRQDAYGDAKVWIMTEVLPGVFVPEQVNIMDVVSFNTVPAIDDDGNGIDTFTQAADDALQVLEYVHNNALDQ